MTMRSPEMEAEYQQAKVQKTLKNLYDEAEVREYKYWKIVVNRYWHDRKNIFGLLIVLKHECDSIFKIETKELHELWYVIAPWLDTKFDSLTINLKAMRSIDNIPHVHVDILKEEFKK